MATTTHKPVFVGADPELFLVDHKGNYVSSIGRFGGTKTHPKPIPNLPYGFAVQEDNVAVEFNVPPARTASLFATHIQSALSFIRNEADKQGLRLAIDASASFPESELSTPAAKEFGCDPDYNVWMMKLNPRPTCDDASLRSAGGHVHIAYANDWIGLGRACDLWLGVPSVMFDPDTRRRLLYGKAGAVRRKPYGVEYRTLSNFWIKSTEMCEMVFNQVQRAVEFVSSGRRIPDEDGLKIIECINNSNTDLVRELVAKYNIPM